MSLHAKSAHQAHIGAVSEARILPRLRTCGGHKMHYNPYFLVVLSEINIILVKSCSNFAMRIQTYEMSYAQVILFWATPC